MVPYKRKTTRQSWSQEWMVEALDAVSKGMPFKTAHKEFGVPLMSLKRRAKRKNMFALGGEKFLSSKRTVFTCTERKASTILTESNFDDVRRNLKF
ncbi:hypothetical protein Zmor_021772 [Zophobas morio]|uniref:HTH psq-type domain-containing protein n=1 Tax=Zophobas morio TaxID=2755281 RepID=A0AA38MB77_9CUCU|nr:hypothetical protein Zmor_021772 [Zophobas morio]